MNQADSGERPSEASTKRLATLISVGGAHGGLWRPDELDAIFRHQMSSPLLMDLGSSAPDGKVWIKLVTEAQDLLLKSFAELFNSPSPRLELLVLTKDFAKSKLEAAESSLPKEVATAVYYLSIAVALIRLDHRITRLPDADLRRGLKWLHKQTFLDEKMRQMLDQAVVKLDQG